MLDAGFQENEIVTATAAVSLVKAPNPEETTFWKGRAASVEEKAAYWKARALDAEAAREVAEAAAQGAENEVKRRLAEIDKLSGSWTTQRNEANAAREALARFKADLREDLADLVREESIERDVANELLEKLKLDPLTAKYTASFTITVTVEGLERLDGKEIEFERAAKAIEVTVDTLHGFQHDWISVGTVEVDDLEELDN
ncbi:hypothetical protein AB0D08_00540 [Kitasatospora sp. NPDC048540]|uniref:hypothetical protein n=1 Tax=Kitasatospora sp. NPDC048540 TaxID=3155634 RepID=UPI0033EB09AC